MSEDSSSRSTSLDSNEKLEVAATLGLDIEEEGRNLVLDKVHAKAMKLRPKSDRMDSNFIDALDESDEKALPYKLNNPIGDSKRKVYSSNDKI